MFGQEQAEWGGLAEAASLLAKRGYGGVQAQALARATRRSVGSLYREFGSKAGVARAVRHAAERDLAWCGTRAWQVTDEPARDFRTPFLAVWDALANWAGEHPNLFAFTYLHPAVEDVQDDDGPLHPREETQARQLVLEVLGAGLSRGVLRAAPAWLLAGVVWGALAELVRASQARGRRLGNAEIAEAGEAVWCALRSPAAVGARAEGTGGARRGTGRSLHPLHARLADAADALGGASPDGALAAHAFIKGDACGDAPRVALHRASELDLDSMKGDASGGAPRAAPLRAPEPELDSTKGDASDDAPRAAPLRAPEPELDSMKGHASGDAPRAALQRAPETELDSTRVNACGGASRVALHRALEPDAGSLEDFLACVAPAPGPGAEDAAALDDALDAPDAPPPPLRTVEDVLARWPRGTDLERWCAQTAMDRKELTLELYLAWREALLHCGALEAQGPPPPELKAFQDMWDQPAWDEDPAWDVGPETTSGGC